MKKGDVPNPQYAYKYVYVRPGSFVCPGSEIGVVTGVETPNKSLKFKTLNVVVCV